MAVSMKEVEQVNLMRVLLEKQKNLYFRLSLSDDPEAIEMSENLEKLPKFWDIMRVTLYPNFSVKWKKL
jgi:hypothetical protein